MTLIPKEPIFVGIEITSDSFKIAGIKKRGNSWIFPILQEIPREEEGKLKDILPKGAILTTSLSNREILIKNLTIPVIGEREVKAAFDFQVEPLLPYPMEKSIATYVKTGEREQNSFLTFFAIKKDSLHHHLEEWKSRLIEEIDVVTAPSAALMALSRYFSPTEMPYFFIHMGKNEGMVALIEKGNLLASRFFEKDKIEIEKTLLSLSFAYKTKQIDTILLLSEEKQWQEILTTITGKTVLYPTLKDLPLSEEHLQKYGLSIGMALGAYSKNFPNFRQKEFQLAFPGKRAKKPILTLVSLVGILFMGCFFLTKSYLHKKEEALLQKFSSFFGKTDVKTLSQLHEELIRIEKQIKESPDLFPLVPLIPKLGDFLAWLSFHSSQQQSGIVIEDFRYHIVKRPDFSKPDEHYQVLVELIFSAENAASAENMRNLLSTSNPFVETKKELEWTIEKGRYKAVFTLKDKTRYY